MFGWLGRMFGSMAGSARRVFSLAYVRENGEPPIRGTRETLEIFETSPWVRAVAGRVAESVGETEWFVEGLDGKRLPDHAMLAAFRGNPVLTQEDLFFLTQLYVDLVGDCFWWVARNGFGVPSQFWPIPPHWVAETPTPRRPSFRLAEGSWQELVPESEIVWFRRPAPAKPYGRGAGLVRAQADEIETHEYASKHAKALFFNRATPEMVVMDEGAGEADVKAHERTWMNRLQGFWRSNRPYFTNRKLEFWQPQQMNLENLTMVPLLKHERDVILQVWGVPPEQFGIVENSNRATAETSDWIMEKRVILPRRRFLRAQIQARVAPEFDSRLKLRFVDTTPANREFELAVMKAGPWAFPEPEWRSLAGRPEEAPEGLRLVPLNSYLTDDPMDPSQRPAAGGAAPGAKPAEPEPEETPEREAAEQEEPGDAA